MYLVKKSLTSTESALFLRDLYDNEYNSKHMSKTVEDIYGPVLKRDSEDIKEFNPLNDYLDEYIKFDLKKVFNISIDQYLNMNFIEKHYILLKAKERLEEINEELEQMSNEIDEKRKSISDYSMDDILGY